MALHAEVAISNRSRTRAHLDALDYLRFVAALMVVAYHYLVYGPVHGLIDGDVSVLSNVAKYGYLGVDLFFIISGFVIMNSARNRSAREFAIARATRLYPAFWLALAITSVGLVLLGERIDMTVSIPQFVANLTMAPTVFGQTPVDGVYWTLLLELKFYFLVFVALLLGQGRRIGSLMPYWAMLMLLLTAIDPDFSRALPFAGGFFAYFATGAILAEMRHRGRAGVANIAGLACSTAVAVFHSLHYSDRVTDAVGLPLSHAVVMVCVLGWTAGVACLLIPRFAALDLPGAKAAGRITYPLYLIHAVLGYIVLSFLTNIYNVWVSCLLAAIFALTVSTAVNKVESWPAWRRFFEWAIRNPLKASSGVS